jgi:CHAT domain-containing protein
MLAGIFHLIPFLTKWQYTVLFKCSYGTDESGTEDGWLEAHELMNLNLHAGLVTLSACETALGKVGQGEDVIGLTWALFIAGVPSTMVSEWKVDSASTTELMLSFHRNLKDGQTKADALRNAALKLSRNNGYNHPFFWAPFVLIGDSFSSLAVHW